MLQNTKPDDILGTLIEQAARPIEAIQRKNLHFRQEIAPTPAAVTFL
jgi:hypothetical protein